MNVVVAILSVIAILVAILLVNTPLAPSPPAPTTALLVKPKVAARHTHNSSIFTQGLEFVGSAGGVMLESGGLYGQSSVRLFELDSGLVLAERRLADEYFAEGITVFNEFVYQLTWREHAVMVYQLSDLQLVKQLHYQYDGWGLCTHKTTNLLAVSNGTNIINFVDPQSFEIIKSIQVQLLNQDNKIQQVHYINELECYEDEIYANIWMQDVIVVIDSQTGFVRKVLDLSHLKQSLKRSKNTDAVLNGIAISNSGRIFVTGKLWDTIYEIKIN
jgi:glutamine cyclotransferase